MHKNQHIKILFFTVTFIFLVSNYVIAQYPTVREKIINIPTFDDRLLHYGYFVGINSYDFKFSYEKDYYADKFKDVEVQSKSGFNVGLIGDLRVNKYINIRIEFFYRLINLIFSFFFIGRYLIGFPASGF